MAKFCIYCEEETELDLARLETAIGESVHSDIPLAIELLFVCEEEIKRLNADTRGVDKVTDVLSFPTLDGIKDKPVCGEDYPFDIDENGNLLIGSVVICIQRAKEQAEEYGHSYERELHYLFVHGVMHCLGYDHIEETDKAEMRVREESVLQKLGIGR